MEVRIDRRSRDSVQSQVVEQLRSLIATGALASGSLLPTVRTLASDLGVNLNTVARAYRTLEQEGFLRIRPRMGVTVAAPAVEPLGDRGELHAALRSLLARLRQAGTPSQEIADLVAAELGKLDPSWRQE